MSDAGAWSKVTGCFLLAAAFLLLIGSALAQTQPAADLVIVNARIYTVNPRQAWAEALALRGEKIVAMGRANEIAAYRGPFTKVLDAKEHFVLPGFTDCHVHFLDGALSLLQVNVDNAKTVTEIQKLVKDFAEQHPAAAWILGRGWRYDVFGASGMPDKKYLDEVIPNRPVYLEGFDAHTWWANSKTLQIAGITRETPDPPGGRIVHDAQTGEPTGAIKEDSADAVVRRAIPKPDREQTVQALREAMREANRAGLVRAISPDGTHVEGGDFGILDIYDELRRKGQLSVRLYIAFCLQPPAVVSNEIAKIEAARNGYQDEWLSAGAAKFFLDGVIESHSAAMLSPYSDDRSQIGGLLWDPAQYKKAIQELDAHGIQVFTHAIGDHAVRLALDAYEDAAQTNHTKDARHRIEHIETVATEDIPRFGKLGVIASMQPLHAYPDDHLLKVWVRNAGPERAPRGFAWYSVESKGGILAFGSDWPVVTMSPWPAVQNAVTRETTGGNPPGGWFPKQRISLPQAIRAYTLGAAIAGHREKTEGSLEPGKFADLIVLSRDLFRIEPTDISNTEVLLTRVGGKVVYQSPEWANLAHSVTGGK